MATLEDIDSGVVVRLRGWHTVGRRHTCDLHLDSPAVSGFHAVVHWNGRCWQARDAGSRNGTFIDGEPIAPGIEHELQLGQLLRFAAQSTWRVRSLEPPTVMAFPAADGAEPRAADQGMLALPDDEQPEASVYLDARLGWVFDTETGIEKVADGSVVTIGGQAWTLSLPETTQRTIELTEERPTIEAIALRFQVSLDQEHIELEVVYGDRVIPLRPRAHMELLLILARQRVTDLQRGDLPESEQGWMYREDLASQLAIFDNRLYVYVHRAREQFDRAGIESAPQLVERRQDTGQVRLGVSRVEILEPQVP